MAAVQLIGLLGGTFDPVHKGHLQIAQAAFERVGFDKIHLIPCKQPPHRPAPVAGESQRLQMLKLALQDCPNLVVDPCELDRDGPSYTFETLTRMRHKDAGAHYCWLMGFDAFQSFTDWFRWRQILELAHLLVIRRPGYSRVKSAALQEIAQQHELSEPVQMRQASAGGILVMELNAPDISATDIRQRLHSGHSVAGLISEPVMHYLQQEVIYS